MTAPAKTYVAPTTVLVDPSVALATLLSLAPAAGVTQDARLYRVDSLGNKLEELTAYLDTDTGSVPTVNRDCTADVHGTCSLTLTKALTWGKDLIMPTMLIKAPGKLSGVYQEFPCGVYVATSPSLGLKQPDLFAVTGYDKMYLLLSDTAKSYAFAGASTYLTAVQTIMRAAGVLGAAAALSTICNYPADWSTKTLPNPMNYALSDGWTYLSIVNSLLKASGCIGMFCDPLGVYTIQLIQPAKTAPLLWTWVGADYVGSPTNWALISAVYDADTTARQYRGDVWNATNQWVFIQNGLNFQPTGTDGTNGRYVVNNTTVPPSDQVTTGRIIRSTVFLDVSGTADLKAQGDKIVADALMQFEAIDLQVTPWPTALWHRGVFTYGDGGLPNSTTRRVLAQQWALPLTTGAMTVNTQVVAGL